MKSIESSGLNDVSAIYSGPQGDLYSLLLGQQLHVGGMTSSLDLAERAAIGAGQTGVDLCCGNGGGMRVLVRFRDVASMVGVDLTPRNVERGKQRCREEGLAQRIRFVVADACSTGLPAARTDFVWGEDAWCYVPDKARLVAEAARLVRPSGTIAFTDWVEGATEMSAEEAQRTLGLMNFANVLDIPGYMGLLRDSGCDVRIAEDTGRLPSFFNLALNMMEQQFTYDVLATVQFRTDLLKIITDNFRFLGNLSRAGKLIQARFVATRAPR
jgi:sarcosine/dimethylglycine N-methyltransferase